MNEVKINVTPVNGQVIIKKQLLKYPVLAINNNSKPSEMGDVTLTIAKSTIKEYKEGVGVIIAPDCPMIKVFDIDDPQDYLKIQVMLKELSNKEMGELMQTTKSFTVVEYLLINHRDILAILD